MSLFLNICRIAYMDIDDKGDEQCPSAVAQDAML